MDEYKSLKELQEALIPAFNVKLRILKSKGIDNISKDDIWNYLRINRWEKATNLGISEMVSDIINVNELDINSYIKKNNI